MIPKEYLKLLEGKQFFYLCAGLVFKMLNWLMLNSYRKISHYTQKSSLHFAVMFL